MLLCLQHAIGAPVAGMLQIQGGTDASVHSFQMLSSDNGVRHVLALLMREIRSGRNRRVHLVFLSVGNTKAENSVIYA